MRHDVVTRSVLGLSALLLAASAGFAWLVGRGAPVLAPAGHVEQPDPEVGERLFALRCAVCHDADELADGLGQAADLDAAAAELASFLADHGSADESEDRAIVAALRARAARDP